jgi:hypothetical protein
MNILSMNTTLQWLDEIKVWHADGAILLVHLRRPDQLRCSRLSGPGARRHDI